MPKVAVIKCEEYDIDMVYSAIKNGIILLGGIEKFVKKNEKILLKPNLISGKEPENAVCTHPAIFEAVLKILIENNIKVTYGDSPGFDSPISAAKKSMIYEVAQKYGIEMSDFENGENITFSEGHYSKQFFIAKGVLNVDGIISLPKMKAHQLTRITGAIKNQFGCVAGLNKALFHLKIPNSNNFSKMLVDLNLYLKPRLYIMDGIVAMEGNGPTSGNPVKMNTIIISDDPVAVDAVFCKLINLNPEYVYTNVIGKEYGLGTYVFAEIEIVGDNIENLINKKFNIPRSKTSTLFNFLNPIKNYIVKKPKILNTKCLKCGICVKSCPVPEKAIFFKNPKKPPVYDYKKCIRCFCCQEVCPHKAIYVKTPLLGKILKID